MELSKKHKVFLFLYMLIGIYLMAVSFSGPYISYLSIYKVLIGEKPLTGIFSSQSPINKPPTTRRLEYDLDDEESYYTSLNRDFTLHKMLYQYLILLEKKEIENIISTLPPLSLHRQEHIARYGFKYNEYSDRDYLNKLLGIINSGKLNNALYYHFDFIERLANHIFKTMNKSDLLVLIKKSGLSFRESETKIQAEFVVLIFNKHGNLIEITTR